MKISFRAFGLLSLLLIIAFAGLTIADDYYGIHQPYLNITATNTIDGVTVNPNTAAPGTFSSIVLKNGSGTTTVNGASSGTNSMTFPTGTDTVVTQQGAQGLFNKTLVNPQINGTFTAGGSGFTTTYYLNPLLLVTSQNIPVASVNATGGYMFLTSATGRTFIPSNVTVMASGTASGSTRLLIECFPSGNVIASIAVGGLQNNIPISPLSSSGVIAVGGVGLGSGCLASDGIIASNVGSNMATTTNLFINMPYTVQ
jgi:hypothetical protein